MYDMIHGCFGMLVALFTLMNIFTLHYDKKVKGVSMSFMVFICVFSGWNIFYLSQLGQYIAVAGAVGLFITNIIWFMQMVYYLILESNEV